MRPLLARAAHRPVTTRWRRRTRTTRHRTTSRRDRGRDAARPPPDGGDPIEMTDRSPRDRAWSRERPDPGRRRRHAHHRLQFRQRHAGRRPVVQRRDLRRTGAAHHHAQQHHALRSATGKQRRLPQHAERHQAFASRDQIAVAVEVPRNVAGPIGKADHRHRRHRNGAERDDNSGSTSRVISDARSAEVASTTWLAVNDGPAPVEICQSPPSRAMPVTSTPVLTLCRAFRRSCR